MRISSSIDHLVSSIAHAAYEGLSDIEYEDRDWEHFRKTKEHRTVKKVRKHTVGDVDVYAMFAQTWGSTALGFGGLGGAAMTPAYTVVLKSAIAENGFCVYFAGRFAYRIDRPNPMFFQDVANHNMAFTNEAKDKYEQTNQTSN